MDQYKIENFVKVHPGVAFPTYLRLDQSHASALRDAIAKSMDSPELNGLALVKKLRAAATEVASLQADKPAFSIARLLSERGLKCPEKVYLNWYRFDEIDQIRLADLDQHLSDIWYPGADDLDVFDDSAAWIVSITHYGKVWLFSGARPSDASPR